MHSTSRKIRRFYHRSKLLFASAHRQLQLWHVLMVAMVMMLLVVSQTMTVSMNRRKTCYQEAAVSSKNSIISSIEQGSLKTMISGDPVTSSQYQIALAVCLKK